MGLLSPFRGMCPSGRAERDVLHDPRTRGVVGAAAVRQSVVPEDQVARLAWDGNWTERMQVLLARVGIRRKAAQPVFNLAVESGDASEGALAGGGAGEIENALQAKVDGKFQAHVKVKQRSGEAPARPLRGIEAGLIDVGP